MKAAFREGGEKGLLAYGYTVSRWQTEYYFGHKHKAMYHPRILELGYAVLTMIQHTHNLAARFKYSVEKRGFISTPAFTSFLTHRLLATGLDDEFCRLAFRFVPEMAGHTWSSRFLPSGWSAKIATGGEQCEKSESQPEIGSVIYVKRELAGEGPSKIWITKGFQKEHPLKKPIEEQITEMVHGPLKISLGDLEDAYGQLIGSEISLPGASAIHTKDFASYLISLYVAKTDNGRLRMSGSDQRV